METNHEEQQALTRQDIEARIITKAWKDEAYKQELLANPKAVIGQEFGVEFEEQITVQVLEENSNSLHFVLPMSPVEIANSLSEEELQEIAGGRKIPKGKNTKKVAGLAALATASGAAGAVALYDRFK